MVSCPNPLDVDDLDSAPCGDEGRVCAECYAAEAKYWASYFGLTSDMTREQRLEKVISFMPPNWEPPV